MKKVTPYKTYKYALASLDNGGRFYNWHSKTGDGSVSPAELAKAAGIFSDRQKMILYLEMSLLDLEPNTKTQVLSHLSDELKTTYSQLKPGMFTPAEARQEAVASSAAIITGIPKLVDSKEAFKGFIMVPIITNQVTTFSMVPIVDEYDIYHLRDPHTPHDFFIAHSRSKRKLSEVPTRCAGIIKELKGDDRGESTSGTFLEMIYYAL